MTINRTPNLQTLQRYQLMFKTSIGTGLVGLVLVAGGLLAWLAGSLPLALPWGLLMVGASGALALKVVQSTARMIEVEGRCGSGR
jgi:hypothetical protein